MAKPTLEKIHDRLQELAAEDGAVIYNIHYCNAGIGIQWHESSREVMVLPEEILAKAIEVAGKAHYGQKDKQGNPFILHLQVVADNVDGLLEKVVAWLHDVVEDSHYTLRALIDMGFPVVITDAVDAITHRPNEPNVKYWERVKSNPLARAVKLADIVHNTSAKRLLGLGDFYTVERLTKKYYEAWQYLTS